MLNSQNDDRTITANVDEVLKALYKNLEDHREIVAEAKKGYLEQCQKDLEEARDKLNGRLAEMAAGKKPDMRNITFSNIPPEDHSREFETVIKMLTLHRNAHESKFDSPTGHAPATIELKALDVQRFVLNDWSWMDKFLLSNARYSFKSQEIAAEKGLL